MYDPKVGRWTSQDPIGFSAGDMDLYRYVGNSPTNLIDPSGLVVGVARNGTPVQTPGGGTVTFPDGQKGKLEIWTGATLYQYHDKEYLSGLTTLIGSMASSAFPDSMGMASPFIPGCLAGPQGFLVPEGDRRPITATQGIVIRYSGPHADQVAFMQTLWNTVYYDVQGLGKGHWDGTLKIMGVPRSATTDPDDISKRKYRLDVYPGAASARYPSTISATGSLAMVDRPTPESWVAAFRADKACMERRTRRKSTQSYRRCILTPTSFIRALSCTAFHGQPVLLSPTWKRALP